ncbi:MAG: hypothetical protein M3014_06595 [Chloroflexota bacterium]|nr:hypothetical protein [Chloroflexota bacterium]
MLLEKLTRGAERANMVLAYGSLMLPVTARKVLGAILRGYSLGHIGVGG